jgi:hypothetical protein
MDIELIGSWCRDDCMFSDEGRMDIFHSVFYYNITSSISFTRESDDGKRMILDTYIIRYSDISADDDDRPFGNIATVSGPDI